MSGIGDMFEKNVGSPCLTTAYSMTVQIYNGTEREVLMTGPHNYSHHSIFVVT